MPKNFKPQSFSYSVCAKIGEGLHSEVYKVVKADLNHNISQVMALKILKSKVLADIWKHEFENLSKISSNYCVRILGWEWISARPALVLEYIEGVSLQDLLSSGSLSILEINFICTQLYWGLKDLQKFGVAHGDLNPRNILFTLQGDLKFIDFGVQGSELEVLYTSPKFCAPELFYEKKPSYEGDLYSLAILRQLLFQGSGFVLEGKDLDFFNILTSSKPLERSNFFLGKMSLLNSWPYGPEQEKTLCKQIMELSLKKQKDQEKTKKIETLSLLSSPDKEGFFYPVSVWRKSVNKKLTKNVSQISEVILNCKKRALYIIIALLLLPAASSSFTNSDDKARVFYTQLSIFTGSWKKIFIDEVFVGYTPISSFYIKQGVHRLRWVSGEAKGDLSFTVLTNKPLLLQASFFER